MVSQALELNSVRAIVGGGENQEDQDTAMANQAG
jgi:hypothetical protein